MARLCSLLFAATLLLPPGLGAAENPKVNCVVKKLDIEIGTITIRRTKGAVEDETFSLLKKDIEVTTPSGEKGRLENVTPGQTVQLKIDVTGDIDGIVIQSQVFVAMVSAVDFENRTITIETDEKHSKTISVDAAARITLAGRSAYLREVKPGSRMNATPSLDGKRILALNLLSDPDGKLASKLYPRIKTSRLKGVRWDGILADVDAGRSEVKLSGPKTKGLAKSMAVDKEALIQQMY